MKFSIHDLTAEQMGVCMAALNAGLGSSAPAPSLNGPQTFIPPVPTGDDESGDVTAQPGQVDANGIPWDDRIHSTPAKLTTKNVWRAKRSVADALVSQVEAELRARGGQPAPAPVMTAPPAPVPMPAPVTMPPGYPPAMPVPAPVPMPAPVTMPPGYPPAMPVPAPVPVPIPPPQPAPAPVAPAAAPTDFNSFMMSIQSLITANKVDAAYFGDLVGRVNAAAGTQFGAITDLATRPDLVGWVWSVMQSDGLA